MQYAQKTPQEKAELKAEKFSWKRRLLLSNPELAATGLSAEQIWKQTLSVNAKFS